jgi:hypothetical protein
VVAQAALLQVKLTERVPGLHFRHLVTHLGKVAAASLLMAAVVAAVGWAWRRGVGLGGWREVAGLGLGVGAGVVVFLGAAWALRVEGLAEAAALAKRKLRIG